MSNRIIWKDVANYIPFQITEDTRLYTKEHSGDDAELNGIFGYITDTNWYVIRDSIGTDKYPGEILAAHNISSCGSWHIASSRFNTKRTRLQFVEEVIHKVCDPPIWWTGDELESLGNEGFLETKDSMDTSSYKYKCPYKDLYKPSIGRESGLAHVKIVPKRYVEEIVKSDRPHKRRREKIRSLYIVLQAQMCFEKERDNGENFYRDVPRDMFGSQWSDVAGLHQSREYYDVFNTLFSDKGTHSVSVDWWNPYVHSFLTYYDGTEGPISAVYKDRNYFNFRLIKRKTTKGMSTRNLLG